MAKLRFDSWLLRVASHGRVLSRGRDQTWDPSGCCVEDKSKSLRDRHWQEMKGLQSEELPATVGLEWSSLVSACSLVQCPPCPQGGSRVQATVLQSAAGDCRPSSLGLDGELRPHRQELRFPTASALLSLVGHPGWGVEGTRLTRA